MTAAAASGAKTIGKSDLSNATPSKAVMANATDAAIQPSDDRDRTNRTLLGYPVIYGGIGNSPNKTGGAAQCRQASMTSEAHFWQLVPPRMLRSL